MDGSYPFAYLVLRAVAATAVFVALAAGALASQKDARNEHCCPKENVKTSSMFQ